MSITKYDMVRPIIYEATHWQPVPKLMAWQNMTKTYKLYGLDFSLFTGKTRSYLRKKGIPFEEISVRWGKIRNFIIERTGVEFIPVVHTPDDKVIQDTTVIIDELETRFPEHSVYPDTPRQKLVSLLLELYADEWLFIPAMHYRWYYEEENYHYIYGKFGEIVWKNAPGPLRHGPTICTSISRPGARQADARKGPRGCSMD